LSTGPGRSCQISEENAEETRTTERNEKLRWNQYTAIETNKMPLIADSLNDYDLMECIEEGLDKFGPGIKYSVMWRMVVQGDSPKEGILVNPKAFLSALRSIFGHSAKVIEVEILGRIKARAKPEYSAVEDLSELIIALRHQHLREPLTSELPLLIQRHFSAAK
jgi:hypothetical protein